MSIIEGTRSVKQWSGVYDFAADGGGPGTITLRSDDGALPTGSVIEGGWVDVATACLSATGTMALQVEAAADLLAASGQAGLTTGRKSIIPNMTGANTKKTTQSRSPVLVIATAAFTAGKFNLVLVYR
jgi:hypothetical protein